jgi:hypothetical protein
MEVAEIVVNVLRRRPGKDQIIKRNEPKKYVRRRETECPDNKNKDPISERSSFRLSLPAWHRLRNYFLTNALYNVIVETFESIDVGKVLGLYLKTKVTFDNDYEVDVIKAI